MARRTFIITECRPIHSGRTKTGNDYTIYDVTAVREDWTPLPDQTKLRSFSELPLHTPIVVDVQRRELQSGVSFTLTPINMGG